MKTPMLLIVALFSALTALTACGGDDSPEPTTTVIHVPVPDPGCPDTMPHCVQR